MSAEAIDTLNASEGLKGARRYQRDVPLAIAALQKAKSLSFDRMLSYVFHPDERVAQALLLTRMGVPATRGHRDLALGALYVRALADLERDGLCWSTLMDMMAGWRRAPSTETVAALRVAAATANRALPDVAYDSPSAILSNRVAPVCATLRASDALDAMLQFHSPALAACLIAHTPVVDDALFARVTIGGDARTRPLAETLAARPDLQVSRQHQLLDWAIHRVVDDASDATDGQLRRTAHACTLIATLVDAHPGLARQAVASMLALAGATEGPTGPDAYARLIVSPRVTDTRFRRPASSHWRDHMVPVVDTMAVDAARLPGAARDDATRRLVAVRIGQFEDMLTEVEHIMLVPLLADNAPALVMLVQLESSTPATWRAIAAVCAPHIDVRLALAHRRGARQDPAVRAALLPQPTLALAKALVHDAPRPDVGPLFRRIAREDAGYALSLLETDRTALRERVTPTDLSGLLRSSDREVRTRALMVSQHLIAAETAPPAASATGRAR
jgi:hypothetical protein